MPETRVVTRAPRKGARRVPNPRAGVSQKVRVVMGRGFPKQIEMKLKYADQFQMTTTAGIAVSVNLSTNGMYDPYFSTGGHQPYYFDQLMAIYDHYCVTESKATFVLTPHTAYNTTINAGIFMNDDGATPVFSPSFTGLLEQTNMKWTIFASGQTVPSKPLNLRWSAKEEFGGDVLSNNTLLGTISTNPSEEQFYTVFVRPFDGSTTTIMDVTVLIEYTATFLELADIAQS